MSESRSEFQLYDNLIPDLLVPDENVPKKDLGIVKKEVKSIVPMEGSTTYGESSTQQVSFRWNFKAVELIRDAKLRGKIKIGDAVSGQADAATKATIDGNMKALFSNGLFQKTNSSKIEQIERLNRYVLSNEIAVSNSSNCDLNWPDWSDNLYKDDSATAGVAGSNDKRHLTTTAQNFEIYLADLINFPRKNHCWFSFAQDGLDLILTFEKDKNILTYNDYAAKIIVTDLYLDIPVYTMNEVYYKEVASQPIVQNYSGVRVFSEPCAATENHISIPVGVKDLIGVKVLFRVSTEENGTVATSPANSQVRYLTKSVDPVITSFQMRIGDLTIPNREIVNNYQLYDYLKEFHRIHHDSDVGNLLNVWNYNNPGTSTQATLNTTDMLYLAFDLSKNGPNTGVYAKDANLEIDISCGAVSGLVADIFCIYSKSFITINKESREVF